MSGIFSYGQEIEALRRDLDGATGRLDGDVGVAAARIDALEADAVRREERDALSRRIDDVETAARERIEALEHRIAAQDGAIARLDEAARARDAAIEALRIEVSKVERQAAIDLEEVRTTARALAGLLLRAEAGVP